MSEFYVGDEVQVIKSKNCKNTVAMVGKVISFDDDMILVEFDRYPWCWQYHPTELRLVKRQPYYLWHVMAREICGGNEQ